MISRARPQGGMRQAPGKRLAVQRMMEGEQKGKVWSGPAVQLCDQGTKMGDGQPYVLFSELLVFGARLSCSGRIESLPCTRNAASSCSRAAEAEAEAAEAGAALLAAAWRAAAQEKQQRPTRRQWPPVTASQPALHSQPDCSPSQRPPLAPHNRV